MNRSFKNTISTVLLATLFFTANAQGLIEKPYREPRGLNNWYVELGGSGLFYSLNYEKVLIKTERWGWIGRVGAGFNPADYTLLNKVYLDGGTLMAPFHSSVLYGRGKEKLELGIGFTLLAKGTTDREVVATAVMGFRVVETNKVCLRITYTPFIRDGLYYNWYGVSLGRNFSMEK